MEEGIAVAGGFPGEGAGYFFAGGEGGVADGGDEGFIAGVALVEAGEAAEVGAGDEDDVDAGDGGDFSGDFDACRGFDHGYDHHIIVGDFAVVRAVESAVLAAAEAAFAARGVHGEFDGVFDFFDVFDHGDDDADCAEVGRFLDVAFGRIGDADEGQGGGTFAGHDHVADALERHGAVLHFDPKEVETGVGHGAVGVGVGDGDGASDDLLSGSEFLFDSVEDARLGLGLQGGGQEERAEGERTERVGHRDTVFHMATKGKRLVLFLVMAAGLAGQTDPGWKGRQVRVLVDLPGDDSGAEVPGAAEELAARVKKYGAGVRRGETVTVTDVKVKGDRLEVHLNGGGFTNRELWSIPGVDSTRWGTSEEERRIRGSLAGLRDKDRRRRLESQYDSVRLRRVRPLREAYEREQREKRGSRLYVRGAERGLAELLRGYVEIVR